MLATWKGVLYAILDGTQDRALTEILRIRKFQDIQEGLFLTVWNQLVDKFCMHKSFLRDLISGFC